MLGASSSSWQYSCHLQLLPLSLSSSSSTRRNDYCQCSNTTSSSPSSSTLKSSLAMKSVTNPPPLSSSSSLPPSSQNSNKNESTNISQIQVPRQKYIPVSKSRLLEALLSMLRSNPNGNDDNDNDNDNEDDSLTSYFTLLSSCLDSILHAEHKRVLEEMRADYLATTQSMRNEAVSSSGIEREERVDVAGNGVADSNTATTTSEAGSNMNMELDEEENLNQWPFLIGLDLFQLFGPSIFQTSSDDIDDTCASVVATATRFQRSFLKLLRNAKFQEISVSDLMLTSALNTDYLLTLPINVDWKRAAESNTIIFRRGYSTEKQRGLLIVEKLDYLQSRILQAVFSLISKPLMEIGVWVKEVIQNSGEPEDMQVWGKKIQLWVQESFLFRQPTNTQASDAISKLDQDLDGDLPIWVAAQKAVSLYEGFLSSIGPRSRLLRQFFTWLGLIPSTTEVPFQFESDDNVTSEPHLRPVFLSRISLSDIWRPATRQFCGNNVWRMLKVGFSIIFSRSVLQEPAFQELILLYTEKTGETDSTGKADIPSLQLKIYEKISMPDLAVVFPHKKLSFRILDTVRLDIASILGLLAYIINYKFEDALSSPSAVLLDIIAVSALIIYLIRVVLGYKQTWDRYQLLVNRRLYEKTLASGFGSIHFLLDASEQQQYKECILAYAILLKLGNDQCLNRKTLGEECERFLYSMFKEKVKMPVNEAVDRLIGFGLVLENTINGKQVLQVVPCSSAYDALRGRWDCLLS